MTKVDDLDELGVGVGFEGRISVAQMHVVTRGLRFLKLPGTGTGTGTAVTVPVPKVEKWPVPVGSENIR